MGRVYFIDDCAACGERRDDIDPRTVSLAMFPMGTRYAWTCLGCGAINCKPADKDTIRKLGKVGLAASAAAQVTEPMVNGRPPAGPALTESDAYDLLLDLATVETPCAELPSLPAWDATMRALERER
jgi:hypothetical protein